MSAISTMLTAPCTIFCRAAINAPWHLISADNKRFARLEILKISCKQIAAALETV